MEVMPPRPAGAAPVASKKLNIKNSPLEDIRILSQYMESKITWNNENTISFFSSCSFVIPILHAELDFNLLLASCYIATNQKEKAIKHLNQHVPQLKCLKMLLSGISEHILKQLFSEELVNNAKLFLFDPLSNIEKD